VFVMMSLFTEQGVPKPAPECTCPLTGVGPVAGTTPFGLSGTVVEVVMSELLIDRRGMGAVPSSGRGHPVLVHRGVPSCRFRTRLKRTSRP